MRANHYLVLFPSLSAKKTLSFSLHQEKNGGKQTEIFCFDLERFKARILTGERWQQLLQAHLYYDHVLTQILLDALPDPDAIEVRRIGFVQKLNLVVAMALIPKELIPPVETINNLRNKLAHDLNFQIVDQSVLDLANCTPKFLRDAVVEDRETGDGPVTFHELLLVVLLQIEITRQKHAFGRLDTRKSEIRLRTVLHKTPGAVYRE